MAERLKNLSVAPVFAPYLDWIDAQQDKMVQRLVQLVKTNSFSYHLKGLDATLDQLADMLDGLGGRMEKVALAPFEIVDDDGKVTSCELGRALRISKRPGAPLRILFSGHMDTVFPVEHPFQEPIMKGDGILQGPGAADLKGGLVVMLATLEAFERSPWADNIGWEVLLNPDEEIGSPGSTPLLEEAARRNHIGLVYEPALADGSLVSSRKGDGDFTAVIRGRSAHAGRDFDRGRNAVCALAEFICRVDELNGKRKGVTLNCGSIRGGGPANIVPDLALVRLNVRTIHPQDEPWVIDRFDGILANLNRKDGIEVVLHGGFSCQPKLVDEVHKQLFQCIEQCGLQLGMTPSFKPSGGTCDGNILAAAGLPNIDTMGVVGGGLHTAEEFVLLNSLAARAKLGTVLLFNLATGRLKWPCGG
jgi:glutamate carboxypeptidase